MLINLDGDLMKDFDVIIRIGVVALDKSDAENQIDYILSELESLIQYDNYKMEIKEVGEYLQIRNDENVRRDNKSKTQRMVNEG